MQDLNAHHWNFGDPAPERGILLIRHAHRTGGLLPPLDAPLTEEGVRAAKRLGLEWSAAKPVRILTSPVERCRRTAEYCKDAANWDVEIKTNPMLGDPGPFVTDMQQIKQRVEREGQRSIIKMLRALAGGEPVPGMRHRDEGVDALMTELRRSNEPTGLLLAITHDYIIACVLAAAGQTTDLWAAPLCGAWIE